CAPAGVGAGVKNTSSVFETIAPSCESAVTPPSRRAFPVSLQQGSIGACSSHSVGPCGEFGSAAVETAFALGTGDVGGVFSWVPAACGKTATTFPVATNFFSSRHT